MNCETRNPDIKNSVNYPISVFTLLVLLVAFSGCAGLNSKSRTAEEKPPEFPYESIKEYLEAGDAESALAEYRSYVETYHVTARDELLFPRLLVAAGRYEEARLELEKLRSRSPATVDLLLAFSYLERISGTQEEEKKYLQMAIELDGRNPEALAALGTLQLEAEDYEQARSSFELALQSDPSNAAALRGLGIVHLKEERYEEAVLSFDRALTVDPANALNFSDRARAKAALKNRKGAVEDLSEAIRLDPDFYWNYIDRGKHFLRMRKWNEAFGDFSKAISIDSQNFLAYVYRAGLSERFDDRKQAIEDYERTLELNPEYYFAHAPLAVLYYMEKNWSAAADGFLRARVYEPDEAAYTLLAALSLKQQGKKEESERYLSEQLSRFSQDSWQREIARYLINPARETYAVNRANGEKNKLIQARMLFYIASQMILQDRVETALRYLQVARQIERPDVPEIQIAEAVLKSYN